MNDIEAPILVFGATGRQGGSVVNALLEVERAVRAVVRDASTSRAAELRQAGVDVVETSLNDTDNLRAAMRGADGVFSVLPGNLPDGEEVRFGTSIADAALAEGVGHFIYSSGASAGEKLTGVPRLDAKPKIEAHVRGLLMASTIIRPMIFMETLLAGDPGLQQDSFSFFVGQEQAMQLIAVDDIGRLVAAIFGDAPRFAGATVTLASDSVTGRDIEAALSEATGRSITYSRFSEELLASKPDFAVMSESIKDGPLSRHADLDLMRELDPELLTLQAWLAGSGRGRLRELLD